MNINDFRQLKNPELKIKLTELRGQLFVLNFQIASGKSNKFADVKKFKVQIAWILTIKKERQIKKNVSKSQKKVIMKNI